MFKYDEEGKVNGTILVHFQLINYGHPVYDLLYLSTDTDFRDQQVDQWLQHFWTTLNQNITQLQPSGFKYEWQDFCRLSDGPGSQGDADEESS